MTRSIAVLGAPSNIGISPYETGAARAVDRAPAALRAARVVSRIGATDLGDVAAPPYRDFTRVPGRVRNEGDVAAYARDVAGRVGDAVADGSFLVVLGGDCSVVLGALLGVRRAGRVPALVYLDGHADFATPATSASGSAASMCLGLAMGRGGSVLAGLDTAGPLVRARDVAVLGRRDPPAEAIYGEAELRRCGALDVARPAVRARGPEAVAGAALERVSGRHTDGFWIHFDADVLDPGVMPAVDSPDPDGLTVDEAVAVLARLAAHPRALGLDLTIYDPTLDPDRSCAERLAALLERALRRDAVTVA